MPGTLSVMKSCYQPSLGGVSIVGFRRILAAIANPTNVSPTQMRATAPVEAVMKSTDPNKNAQAIHARMKIAAG